MKTIEWKKNTGKYVPGQFNTVDKTVVIASGGFGFAVWLSQRFRRMSGFRLGVAV